MDTSPVASAPHHLRRYYHSEFRSDVARFFAGRSVPYFGHAWRYTCHDVEAVAIARRPGFLACLFFTVLADQAMHCHFRSSYARFEHLTRYPKFCFGLGQFQLNPYGILEYPVAQALVDRTRLVEILPEAMHLFVAEVDDFCRTHQPEVAPAEFFQRLVRDPDVQVPELLPLLDPAVRDAERTIVFAQTREAAQQAVQTLGTTGIKGEVLDATMAHEDRRTVLAGFEDGTHELVAAPQLLDEGVDVPAADLAIVLAGSRSKRQMIQRMGRVLRKKRDGRVARITVLYVAGTAEDPVRDDFQDFLDLIWDAADDVVDFRPEDSAGEAVAYLNDWAPAP
jgi:hypothetical protein